MTNKQVKAILSDALKGAGDSENETFDLVEKAVDTINDCVDAYRNGKIKSFAVTVVATKFTHDGDIIEKTQGDVHQCWGGKLSEEEYAAAFIGASYNVCRLFDKLDPEFTRAVIENIPDVMEGKKRRKK